MTGSKKHHHLAELFRDQKLRYGSVKLAQELDASLSQWPWAPTRMDWGEIANAATASLDSFDSLGLGSFLDASGFKHCSFAAALLEPTEPPIIGRPDILFIHLDKIFWGYPDFNFIFGCSETEHDLVPKSQIMAQYNKPVEINYIRQQPSK